MYKIFVYILKIRMKQNINVWLEKSGNIDLKVLSAKRTFKI